MPARKGSCPLCINEEASIPARGTTLCDTCGTQIGENDPRVLLVSRSSLHNFCTPDCLKEYQKVDELYTKKGSMRDTDI
jgi:hypothetical protein